MEKFIRHHLPDEQEDPRRNLAKAMRDWPDHFSLNPYFKMRDFVQSLWVGSRLSTMEQLAIRSFLHHGHGYHLYTYDPPSVENLPPGAEELDAEAILPNSAIFEYTGL